MRDLRTRKPLKIKGFRVSHFAEHLRYFKSVICGTVLTKGGFNNEIYRCECSTIRPQGKTLAMTLDTYGDANADALTFASVKLKDTFNDNTDYFKSEEEQEDTEEE